MPVRATWRCARMHNTLAVTAQTGVAVARIARGNLRLYVQVALCAQEVFMQV
jgi:hypothetical protein